ncbi:hypothetical protein CDD82_5601 [Ophiocordyceps australis]|uniref:Histidine kinase n=1 Tax=Ophiocordyceps australis TaxID=1399860 RepID=A0A2C5YZN1_9HYPO|nr:hypothetical protein CDD82_5601 [Ophiocordyceps australis]
MQSDDGAASLDRAAASASVLPEPLALDSAPHALAASDVTAHPGTLHQVSSVPPPPSRLASSNEPGRGHLRRRYHPSGLPLPASWNSSSDRQPGPPPGSAPAPSLLPLAASTSASASSSAAALYHSSYYAHHHHSSAPKASRSHRSAKRSSRHLEPSSRAMDQAPAKKARTGSSPQRVLEFSPPVAATPSAPKPRHHREGSSSPLFFSHAAPRGLARPLSSTASEVAACMLSRPGREDTAGGVTTVKLPRASVSSTSPAVSGSTPGSLGSSVDISASSLSPENRNLAPGMQAIQGIGVIELLEHDERPTFLIDLANPVNVTRTGLNILYYNNSLRACPDIYNLVTVDSDAGSPADAFDSFKAWVYTIFKNVEGSDLQLPYHEYGYITWTCTTLRHRYRFVSGNISAASWRHSNSPFRLSVDSVALAPDDSALSPSMPVTPVGDLTDVPDYFGDAVSNAQGDESAMASVKSELEGNPSRCHPDEFTNQVLQLQPIKSMFDWTRVPITENLPEHIKFAKSIDWASTSLGPISEWSYDLRAMSNLVMGSPHPAAMYWGPDQICIYNAAYIDLAGGKHPSLMGSKYTDAWPEIWDEIEPIFKSAIECGQATMKHDNQLFIKRDGFLEETFFSWAIVPLVGSDGEVVGLYNPAFENTLRRVNDRRMLTLREIGETTATATTVSGFWPQVQKGFEYNDYDVPFSLIYSIREDSGSEVSSLHSGSFVPFSQLVLEGSPGVPQGHVSAPSLMDLKTSEEGFAPYMRQCMATGGEPVVLSEEAGTLPPDLIEGFEWRGFGDACRTIVVFPVVPTTKEAVTGFIVIGVNPRRPYDDNYKLFIHLLSRQLATSMASVVLFEEEIRRGQRAARLAALDRQELSMQLLLRTQEASESETRFTRMAEYAPVGMFIADADGHIDYCNDMWWQISRHSRFDNTELAWMNSVRDEDRPCLENEWQRLLHERVTISVEFRFKHSQQRGDHSIDTWVLMSAFPEKNLDGRLKSIFGCMTDISSQKWAEKVQNERREEAVELKRQQENFIDITSHEMRNPLSAVLQCADQIANNIAGFTGHKDTAQVETLLEGCLDAANTINLCASHQKRIVDDILTLSKLDSNLLAVTPVDEQPVKVVQRALKMFESELVAHDIELEFNVDDSLDKYGIEWVKLDPSRLRQVLINLMTNAIKFTQGRERRSITVSLSASKDIGEITQRGVEYFERNHCQRNNTMDIDNESEWGSGDKLNLHCSVEDTGPGLSEEELKVLFQRFQQATPRTHVQYGGSGLGLFISRILTEMQGGQVGVSSVKGQGSRFNFYIQARKSLDPPAEYERISPFKIGRKVQAPCVPTVLAGHSKAAGHGRPLFDVLIVEDNIVNQKVLQRQLRNCGNNTFVANHGREALQTLEKSRFWAGQEANGVDISVILMDLEMPVMDGMTCAKKIRELERQGVIVKHIPIIAVTAYARPEQIENAKAAGIDDVISKPFRIPELIPKIEELVGRANKLPMAASTDGV